MDCESCGAYSGNYPLCKKCYYLSKDGKLIKCEKCNKWHMRDVLCNETKTTSENYTDSSEFVYNLKPSLLTDSEKSFYYAMKSVISDDLCIFPQINLATVISKNSSSHFQNELFRNIDFLITDKELKPLIFIEINDSSHNSQERKARDLKVHDICEEAGIPIITLWTSYGVNKIYIKQRIEETLASLPIKRIVHSKKEDNKDKKNSSSQGCYVATCVYGSYDCPEVWTLRRFRDFYLSKSWYGRTFIRIYYTISPKLVKLFGNAKWFKHFGKNILNRLVIKLKSNGYKDTPYYDR